MSDSTSDSDTEPFLLSADRYAGLQIRWTNNLTDRRCGHQFDPEVLPVLEPGRLARPAQCVHAALLRSGSGLGEGRQLKDDPRALVHFGQTESDFRSFGFHLDLGAGLHGALVAGDLELLAVANKRDGRLRRTTGKQSGTLGLNEGSLWSIPTADRGQQSEPGGPRFEIDRARKFSSAVGEIQAADITLAHRGVPGRLDLAGVVGDDAVVLAVVEHDVGIGDAGHRTVQVAERQGPILGAAAVVIIEPGIVFRELDRLGVDEFRTADRASGT